MPKQDAASIHGADTVNPQNTLNMRSLGTYQSGYRVFVIGCLRPVSAIPPFPRFPQFLNQGSLQRAAQRMHRDTTRDTT